MSSVSREVSGTPRSNVEDSMTRLTDSQKKNTDILLKCRIKLPNNERIILKTTFWNRHAMLKSQTYKENSNLPVVCQIMYF